MGAANGILTRQNTSNIGCLRKKICPAVQVSAFYAPAIGYATVVHIGGSRDGKEIIGHLWRALAWWVSEKRVCLPTSDALVLAPNNSFVGSVRALLNSFLM